MNLSSGSILLNMYTYKLQSQEYYNRFMIDESQSYLDNLLNFIIYDYMVLNWSGQKTNQIQYTIFMKFHDKPEREIRSATIDKIGTKSVVLIWTVGFKREFSTKFI